MNAASKGHLPVVLYLLTKQGANPLVRNNWGETAYDAAAAVFEVWICEVLSRFEAEKWRGTTVPYDPLAVHTTVPLILYENQRLDTRLKTLAVSGGRPKFSASGLGKQGRRPPFELKLLTPDESGQKIVPAWRSDVLLPLRDEPLKLPQPGSKDQANREGAERSHFWLSDWTLDVTLPEVDAETGWQYSNSFDDPDDQWTPEPPPRLERLLTGGTAVAAGLGASGSGSSPRSRSSSVHSQSWVRRRRWVRVMRRRLDIPPLPFLGPDGGFYHWLPDGTMVPFEDTIDDFEDGEGQELGTVPSSHPLTSAQDYVARARYLAGAQTEENNVTDQHSSAIDARRAIAKLERATTELRQGMLGDEDVERKTHASVLLHAYSRELDRRRLAAGAQGLLISNNDPEYVDDDDDEEEEFHYPGSSPVETMRAPSIRSYTTEYFGRPPLSRGPTDLTPHLAQAPEFRVPTHEAPQKVVTPKYTPPTPHEVHARWERDHQVSNCRDCQRRFNFLLRRHHCRRCGRIFCDRCSSFRVLLDPSDIVHDPSFPESTASASSQRVCQSCHDAVTVNIPPRFQENRVSSMERIFIDQARLSVPSLSREASSQLSDLADCPVCSQNLAELGSALAQEAHVKSCLDGGTGQSPQSAKYLVYKLPGESTLIGTECVICLEEFVKDSMVARLSCLCSFHNTCLSSWLQRGRSCPVHARDP
ncbi:FYVE-domain-containing protein [Artomyces pyxidatus]|uniref:FYVE-domain-containing protein n=1 Tax=Artomyces pyxidatus TaxID=48021 RepID=A0ACB8TKL7_9AGAM|nr:FYVE-domain-containing protein [Artomyces pyxidatus]